jgi:hypothetical protein
VVGWAASGTVSKMEGAALILDGGREAYKSIENKDCPQAIW